MSAAAIQTKNYWYYSNGSYELESIQYDNGDTRRLDRHITGPMPKEEILNIIRDIDPNGATWLNDSIGRLARHRFNTTRIIEGVPQECGVTTTAYLKSFLNWKTAGKCAAVGGGTIMLALSPGLLARHAPEVAEELGLPVIEEGVSLIRYSYSRWSAMLLPSKASTATEILVSIGQTYVITRVSKRAFEKLNESCGPKGFRAWKAQKMDVFIQNKEDIIPERHENDQVLSSNICPITNLPIRVPCRTQHGQLFEESAIKSWIAQQVANDIQPTCPLTRQQLTFQDLNIDYVLSDQIELRLLLLNSR